MEFCREQRLPYFERMARVCLGTTAIEEGRPEEGIRLLEEALAAAAASYDSWANSATLGLAAAYGMVGRLDEASRLLTEAREWTERSGQRAVEPLIEGVAAMLALLQGNRAETEAHLRKAAETSRRQKAKFLEVRFATALARLYAAQGRKEEGRQLLKEVYDWFTEGFDTRHLKEARALLDELN